MSLKYKSHWKHPPKIRSSSSNSAAAGPELHAPKEKRLQIADPEPIQVPRSDAPKTSEFAYFKKFKKELGGGSRSSSLNRSDNLNTNHNNGLDFESTIAAKGFEDLRRNIRTSFQAETQGPADRSLIHSPSRIDVDNYIVENRKAQPHELKNSSFRLSGHASNGSQDVFSSPFAGVATKVSGNQSADDGIFSTKRKNLRQCVAESFKDVEGLNVNSKGFDLMSTLLSRLLPPKDETKCYRHSKSKERVIGADDHPPAFPEPDTFEKSRTVSASTSDSGPLWNDVLPAPWSGRPKDKALPEWDMIASGFRQTKYDFGANLLDFEGDRLHGFDHENTVNFLCADNDSYSTESLEKLHSNGLRLRELDDFHDPDEPSRNKPCNLLLSLDDEDDKDNSHTMLRNVGYRQIVHDTLDEACLPRLSLWSGRSFEYPDFRLTDAYMHEPWKIHKDDYAIEVAERFPQHFPSPPRYLTWDEDSDTPKDLNYSRSDLSRDTSDDLNYCLTDLSCDTPSDLNYSLTNISRDMPADDLNYNSLTNLSRDTPDDLIYNSLTDLSSVDLTHCTSLISNKESVFETVHFSKRRLNTDLAWECLPLIDLFSYYPSNSRIFQFPWKEDLMPFASDNNDTRKYDSNSQEKYLPSSYDGFDCLDQPRANNFDLFIGKAMGNSLLLDYPCRVSNEGEYCLNDDDS